MNYILSIIIPTKNRYITLFPLVDAIVEFNSNDIEIVIQDNSDNNQIALDYIASKNNTHIKYYYSDKQLSQGENSDMAVHNSTGEYVCFIGDDDGVMPYIADVVKWMKENKFEILKSVKPQYFWPNQKINIFSKEESGVLFEKNYNYEIKEVDNKKALNYLLSRGGILIKELPCLYQGIVKRTLLDEIYKKTSLYFPGPSPDMANAVALSLISNRYTYVGFPVIIDGISKGSAGGKGIMRQHVAKIDDVAQLPKYTSQEWDGRIPKYWTTQTIFAQSVLDSLKRMGSASLIEKLNFPYLYASLYLFHFRIRKILFKDFNQKVFNAGFFLSFAKLFFFRSITFIRNRIKFANVHGYNSIPSIKEAINRISDSVDKKKLYKILSSKR